MNFFLVQTAIVLYPLTSVWKFANRGIQICVDILTFLLFLTYLSIIVMILPTIEYYMELGRDTQSQLLDTLTFVVVLLFMLMLNLNHLNVIYCNIRKVSLEAEIKRLKN